MHVAFYSRKGAAPEHAPCRRGCPRKGPTTSTESLNCPNCGAPLLNAAGHSTVVCDHCGSVIALKLPPPAPAAPDAPRPNFREEAPREPSAVEPRYEYGQVPNRPLARSDLTSVALGPDDAAHVIQLLHDGQQNDAIQFYQSKTGVSPDEASDAISAIEAGLRDVLGARSCGGGSSAPDPATLPEVVRLAENGDAIGAIRAYRDATGVGLREAKGRIDALDNQLRQQRARAGSSPAPLARRRSGALGCSIGCLSVIALFMCIFGGCSAYVQSRAIYQCSLTDIKTALAQKDVFAPPINAGYLVLVRSFTEEGGGSDYYLNMAYTCARVGLQRLGLGRYSYPGRWQRL